MLQPLFREASTVSIIAEWVESLGGFAQKQQLVAMGASDLALTAAVRSGAVRRPRQGWYTTAFASDQAFRAVRCGGRLTGLSAIRAEGGWVLDADGPLHVSLPRNAARLRSPANRRVRLTAGHRHGVALHWDDHVVAERGSAVAVALHDALVRVVLDDDLETAVAAIDWALHTGRLDRIGFEVLILALPLRLRGIRHWVDRHCESLPESLCRTRLRMLGHTVESQVRLPSGRRIDLLINGVVGVETDGEEFHRDEFEADRRKDLEIAIAGFLPLRLPARLVFHEWELCRAAVHAVVAACSSENSGTWQAPRP